MVTMICPDPAKCSRGPEPHAWSADCELASEAWGDLDNQTRPDKSQTAETIGALFVEWAVREHLFSKYSNDYRVAVDLCNAFAAGFALAGGFTVTGKRV